MDEHEGLKISMINFVEKMRKKENGAFLSNSLG